jgi:hypothetical protein
MACLFLKKTAKIERVVFIQLPAKELGTVKNQTTGNPPRKADLATAKTGKTSTVGVENIDAAL